jgi:hypothetical protein
MVGAWSREVRVLIRGIRVAIQANKPSGCVVNIAFFSNLLDQRFKVSGPFG